MKYKLFILLVLIFWNCQLEAQHNYKKGLLVSERGDTLRGYINDRDWGQNPDNFTFRDSLSSGVTHSFGVENTTLFQIEGEDIYHKFTVQVSMDEIRLSKLHYGVDTSRIVKEVFLKLLVEGCNVNLYMYTDELKTRFYCWDKTKELPEELSYKIFYYLREREQDIADEEKPAYESDNSQRLVERKNYMGQLKYLASSYGMSSKELDKMIGNSKYDRVHLSEIVVQINGNNAANFCMISRSEEKFRLAFFASIQVRKSNLNYMEAYSPFYIDVNNNVDSESVHKPYWFPTASFGFDLMLKSGSRFYLREEVALSRDILSSTDQYKEPLNYYYEDYELSFSQWNFAWSSGVNFNIYHASVLKIYVGAAINLNYSNTISSMHYSHGYDLYNEQFYTGPLLRKNEYWIAVPLKAGIIIRNRFEIKYAYQNQRHVVQKMVSPRKIGTMELGVGFFLNSQHN